MHSRTTFRSAPPCHSQAQGRHHHGCRVVRRVPRAGRGSSIAVVSDVTMTIQERADVAAHVWTIETYHRGLKQFCAVERCAARSTRAQRNYIGCMMSAFLRLEHHRSTIGTSWFNTKLDITRPALQHFLSNPKALLEGFEQAIFAHKRATV